MALFLAHINACKQYGGKVRILATVSIGISTGRIWMHPTTKGFCFLLYDYIHVYTHNMRRIYVYSLYTLYGHMGGKVRFLIMGKGKMEKRLNMKHFMGLRSECWQRVKDGKVLNMKMHLSTRGLRR